MLTKYLLVAFLLILGYSCKKDNASNPDPFIRVSRTDVEVGNDVGYTDTIVIQSNLNWTIDVAANAGAWLSVDPAKKTGEDKTVVIIKVTAANTASSQTGTITITSADGKVQPILINISRKAYSLTLKKCYGGSGDDYCYATALLPTGQFVTTGISSSTDGDAAGNSGLYAGWALGAGSDGNRLWQKQVNVYSLSVVASPDGGFVSAGGVIPANGHQDLAVVKYDANGNIVWNKTYGGSDAESANKIIATTDGGYLVAGNTSSQDGDVKNNHGGSDAWVIKLDGNGNFVWGKTFGGTLSESLTTVAACSDGGYIILSTTESNNTGDVQGSRGQQDFFVVKIDASGNKIWSKTVGGSSADFSASIMSDTDGGCILLGSTTSTDGDVVGKREIDSDLWVLKLTKDGKPGWQAVLGGSGTDRGASLARMPDGHIAIAGSSNSTDHGFTGNHGGTDVWVLVATNTGKVVWQKLFGSTESDANMDITAAADGSLLITNLVWGNNGDVTGNHGLIDTWIFKLN